MYLAPNLPSSKTVTITAGGFPEGKWLAIPVLPPLVLCCELLPRVRSHIRPMSTRAATAKACDRYRRGIEKPTPKREVLLPRGRKGGAFEDFLLGYGRCIIYYLCLVRTIWLVVRGLWCARSPSVKATARRGAYQPPEGRAAESNGLSKRVAMTSEVMQPTGERRCRVSVRQSSRAASCSLLWSDGRVSHADVSHQLARAPCCLGSSLRLAPARRQSGQMVKQEHSAMKWCNACGVAVAHEERVNRVGGRMLVWERQVVGLGLTGG